MTDETSECLKCFSEISVKAKRCPECGYEPSKEAEIVRQGMMIVGFLLSLTFIGALVGGPMMYIGHKAEENVKEMSPTETPPDR